MSVLHGELVAMQEWVKASGTKICVVFEGRDTAGKGGTIKRITERVSPRVFRVVALPAPTKAPDGATGLPEPGQEAGMCAAVGGRDAPGRGGRGVRNHEKP